MKLYNYLENLLNNDFIDANGLFLYKNIINNNQKDLEDLCEKNDLRPLTLKEFTFYIRNKKENFLKLLNQIGIKKDITYKIFIKDNDFFYTIFNNQIEKATDFVEVEQGIALLKHAKINKVYKDLEDLENKSNLGLLVDNSSNSMIKIICYDKDILNSYQDQESEHVHPILFFGKIKNDGKDNSFPNKKTPYGAAMVAISVAREDVSGYNILYPIMAYYAKDNLLIPDRVSVSKDAQKVWEKRFSKNGYKLKRFAPIDNINNPITPKEEDDGKTYKSITKNKFINEPKGQKNSEIIKDKNISDEEKLQILKKLRKNDELNWVYKLESTAGMSKVINQLIQNHEVMKMNGEIKEDVLDELSKDLFRKRRED